MSNPKQVTLEEAHKLAEQLFKEGNITLAERTYQDILAASPNDFLSLHHLGVISYNQGKPEDALDFLTKAIEQNDENCWSWNAYGVMLSENNKKEKAIDAFEKAIEIEPNYPDAYSNMGFTYWQLKNYDESEKACRKALELNPELLDGYINLGTALSGKGMHKEAIKEWEKALEIMPLNANALINIGNAQRNIGQIQDAKKTCEKALELSPNNPSALLNYANVLKDLGQLEDAEKFYRKAIGVSPKFVEAHNNLSIVLMSRFKYDDAAASARFSLAFSPDNASAYNNLATCLRETGDLKGAEEASRKALQLNPDSAEAKIELADILFLSDRLPEAETLISDALEKINDNPRIYMKLSAVLEKSNRIDDALEAAEKARDLSPEMPEIYHRLGMIYYMSNQIPEALKNMNKALELKPDFAVALGSKSEILQSHGDMEGALENALKALEINPNLAYIYYSLSKLKKFTSEDDHDLQRMISIAEDDVEKTGTHENISLHFALFKAYEDLKNYDKAFEHLKIGNDLKRSTVVYDKSLEISSYKHVVQSFTSENLSKFEGKGSDTTSPIFIVGMPRSGTTLTEQIISSHPKVFGAGELYILSALEKKLGSLTPETARKWGETYEKGVRAIHPDAQKAERITDKMPGNYARIGQIIATMPNAKIIHCRRNPIDTCLSCYKQLFARGQYWSYNLEEMAAHYKHYATTMEHWRNVAPDKFIEIKYEDTVNNFEEQARMLIDYVGLEWDDACLTPHKTKRTILTASKGQVRKPIYKTSIEAWRRYEEQLADFAKAMEPFMLD